MRVLLCLIAVSLVDVSHAGMLITSVTIAKDVGGSSWETATAGIFGTNDGIPSDRNARWNVPISPELIGHTYIGDDVTIGRHRLQRFNHWLTQGNELQNMIAFWFINEGGVGIGVPMEFLFVDVVRPSYTVDSNFTTLNGIDMEGFHLTRLELEITQAEVMEGNRVLMGVELRIFAEEGQVPEPGSLVLLLLGLAVSCHRTAHCRQ